MGTVTRLTVAALAALTLGIGGAHAQTKSQKQTCGVEVWNTEKMNYEMMPCSGEEPSAQDAKANKGKTNAAKCGVETWNTDKMTYETTPCIGTQ